MRSKPILQAVALAALTVGLSGCAMLPKFAKWVEVRPVQAASSRPLTRKDRYYQSAVGAIANRDYALALDYLQTARAADPTDVRVLNAFGVVYDKLGRFDLSRRYYEQARVLAPDSAVVATNEAYSLRLQGWAASEARPVVLGAVIGPEAAAPATVPPPATVVRLAAARTEDVRRLPAVVGAPLLLADATGRPAGTETVRTALSGLGWSIAQGETRLAEAQMRTSITYSPALEPVAKALERTLPGPVEMVVCHDGCRTIRLALGADAAGWYARPDRASLGE